MSERRFLTIALALSGFVLVGLAAEHAPQLAAIREALRGNTAPGAMPDDVPESARAVLEGTAGWGAVPTTPADMPSSILAPEQLRGLAAVLSLVTDQDNLDDPETGILADRNRRNTGREWERPAWATLYDGGAILAASPVGLRAHGDSARRSAATVSFRLYFRPDYRATAATAAMMLGGSAAPASELVVRRTDPQGLHPDLFAFAIARRIGAVVPDHRPVRLFVNGEERGLHLLTERVAASGWGRSHFGADDFVMHTIKGQTDRRSRAAYEQGLVPWASSLDSLTMEQAAEVIDVDNLSRHLLAVIFCGTTDWAQGGVVLDTASPDPRWSWVLWDMDQSFWWWGQPERPAWRQPATQLIALNGPVGALRSLGLVTDWRHQRRHLRDPRRLIFNLLLEDPAYREAFARLVSDTLNHRLDQRWLRELLRSYGPLIPGPGPAARGADLAEFFDRRPDQVRRDVARHLSLGGPHAVRLRGAAEREEVVIDGFAQRLPYRGEYFTGQQFRVELSAATRRRLSHWVVNGNRLEGADLELVVDEDLEIQAVMIGEAP